MLLKGELLWNFCYRRPCTEVSLICLGKVKHDLNILSFRLLRSWFASAGKGLTSQNDSFFELHVLVNARTRFYDAVLVDDYIITNK